MAGVLLGVKIDLTGKDGAAYVFGPQKGVSAADVAAFDGAFLCNSATPVCPITAVDAVVFQPDPAILTRIAQAWTAQPPQILG